MMVNADGDDVNCVGHADGLLLHFLFFLLLLLRQSVGDDDAAVAGDNGSVGVPGRRQPQQQRHSFLDPEWRRS